MSEHGVLLASGGLDSTTLAYWLRSKNVDVVPLFINYGQHCHETELSTARKVLPADVVTKLEIVDISDVYRDSQSRLIKAPDLWRESVIGQDLYLPYRNILVLSVGAAFAAGRGFTNVYSAFINSNHAKEVDCSAQFFDRLNELLVHTGAVKISMPFRTKTKLEVARIGLDLGVPILQTYSCQAAAKIPCGACPNCVDRLTALEEIAHG